MYSLSPSKLTECFLISSDFFQAAHSQFDGKLGAVVNAAGIINETEAEFKKTVDVNFVSLWHFHSWKFQKICRTEKTMYQRPFSSSRRGSFFMDLHRPPKTINIRPLMKNNNSVWNNLIRYHTFKYFADNLVIVTSNIQQNTTNFIL